MLPQDFAFMPRNKFDLDGVLVRDYEFWCLEETCKPGEVGSLKDRVTSES